MIRSMNENSLPNYSILLAVYYKDNASWFKQSIESMLTQTVKSNDFVIVCDGPLTEDLNQILTSYSKEPKNNINVVQLDKNRGLGNALNIGIQYCKNEIVVRMDSDDVSKPERCEKELNALISNEVDIVSSAIEEF